MFLCGGPRNAENSGAQKNLNVAILAQLYHAQGMGHRTHPGNEFQRENLCVNGVLLIWIRRNQMKYRIYFKNHGKYKIYRNILTESPIKLILPHLEHPRLTG